MAEITVKQLAQLVDRSVETLLIQMKEAGLPARGADGLVSDAEKQQLVSFLKRSHGDVSGDNQQITLKRKTLSTLKRLFQVVKQKRLMSKFVKPVLLLSPRKVKSRLRPCAKRRSQKKPRVKRLKSKLV